MSCRIEVTASPRPLRLGSSTRTALLGWCTSTVCARFNKNNAFNAGSPPRAVHPVDDAFHTTRNVLMQAVFVPQPPKRGGPHRGKRPRTERLPAKDGGHDLNPLSHGSRLFSGVLFCEVLPPDSVLHVFLGG